MKPIRLFENTGIIVFWLDNISICKNCKSYIQQDHEGDWASIAGYRKGDPQPNWFWCNSKVEADIHTNKHIPISPLEFLMGDVEFA